MKKFITIILILITGIVYSQCDNGTNYYPSSVYTPTDNVWGSATSWNYAGEVIQVNIVLGDEYEFSTCDTYGGVLASYDTQLTLRDAAGNLLAFNDDFSGCLGFTSYVKYTATYTGVLYVHLNEYNCASNSTLTEVMIYKTPASGGGGGVIDPNSVTVGDLSSGLDDGRVPTYGYYDFSWSASLYTAMELNKSPMLLEKISWNVTNGASMLMTNQEIWFAMTLEEEFMDGTMPDMGVGSWTDWKLVYAGDIDFKPGWNEIVLQGSYLYDGMRSLLVKVVNNHGAWASSYPEFQYTTKSNSVVYNYDDGVFPGPIGYRNSIRPNTRFGFGGGGALPIDLISFTGEVLGGDINPIVLIEWTTLSQVNNDYFEIQRSDDAEVWYTIETVSGAGNTNSEMSYVVIDDNPLTGISYYRLKQTDYDGQYESFHPVSIIISSEEKIINKVVNLMGQEVNEPYKGMVLEIYQDGTYVKKYYE